MDKIFSGIKLATAESCTGGGLGAAVTSVPGSSGYYLGGVISYADRIKTEILSVRPETLAAKGAVSRETAEEMAYGCRSLFGADYAVAVTGIAGPAGGTKEKPVGTVWISVSGEKGFFTEKYVFAGERNEIREKAVAQCLENLRKVLHEEKK